MKHVLIFPITLLALLLPASILPAQDDAEVSLDPTELAESAEPTSGEAAALAQAVAKAYGIEAWPEVSEITFTFHVSKQDTEEVTRRWRWQPQDNTVTFYKEDAAEPVRYFRTAVARPEVKEVQEVDRHFVNDSFWLLFPFHIMWAENIEFSVEKNATAPISGKSLTKLTVQYPQEGGYTPGDAYDAYLSDDNRIQEWVYRQAGQEEPSLAVSYEDHQQFGPITLSVNYPAGGEPFRVWFTEVEIAYGNSKD